MQVVPEGATDDKEKALRSIATKGGACHGYVATAAKCAGPCLLSGARCACVSRLLIPPVAAAAVIKLFNAVTEAQRVDSVSSSSNGKGEHAHLRSLWVQPGATGSCGSACRLQRRRLTVSARGALLLCAAVADLSKESFLQLLKGQKGEQLRTSDRSCALLCQRVGLRRRPRG